MALSISGGKWQLKYAHGVRNIPVLNNSGGALTAGTIVRFSSGTLAACGDSNTVGAHGVLQDDVAASTVGSLYPEGVFRVGVSGTIDFGLFDPAYTTTNGLIDTGSASDVEVGRVIGGQTAPNGSEPVSGDAQVDVLLRSLVYHLALLTHA